MKAFHAKHTLPATAAALAVGAGAQIAAAQDDQPHADEERQLIAVLQSDAAPLDKDLACRRLAVIGTKAAVPALAALLSDEQLCGIARVGLEPIPDPAVDDALRAAMGSLKGRQLIGVIGSIGVRRDRKAVPALVRLLADADEGVAGAAATALGKIGDAPSAAALERALGTAPAAVRPVVGDACLRCGQALVADGRRSRALALYDRVRQADLPAHILAAATRGAVLERGAAGVPLLVELLKTGDGEMLAIGLRLVREVPGAEVSKTLTAELPNLPADRRDLVTQALKQRSDAEEPGGGE